MYVFHLKWCFKILLVCSKDSYLHIKVQNKEWTTEQILVCPHTYVVYVRTYMPSDTG